jgi:hypothetical protein
MSNFVRRIESLFKNIFALIGLSPALSTLELKVPTNYERCHGKGVGGKRNQGSISSTFYAQLLRW